MPRLTFATGGPLQLRPGNFDSNNLFEWEFPLQESIIVPDITRWVPVLDFEVLFVFNCVQIDPNIGRGDRFLNPTQSQIGYFQEMYNGFVADHGRILYAKQFHRAKLQPISLPTSGANRSLGYREVEDGGFDQMANSARLALCYTESEEDAEIAATGYAANTQELQFRVERGLRTIAPIEPNLFTFTELTIEAGIHYPDRLTGVIWPGWAGTVSVEISTYSDLSLPGFLTPDQFRTNPDSYQPPIRPCDGAAPAPPPPPPPGGPLDPIIL